MRLRSKYKGYNQLAQVPERFALRILKFKNTKWKKIQTILSKSLKNKKSFNENLSMKVPYKMWEKINNYYKDGNKLKNLVFNLYDKAVSPSYFRSVFKTQSQSSKIKNMYLNLMIKPEFRLDILLWKLNFFKSSYHSRQAINENKITVNNKFVLGNFFLSKGDVVSFEKDFDVNLFNLQKNQNDNSLGDTVFSFVEIDYYSNSIVVVKDLKELTVDDFYLLIHESYNLLKIKDYIR